MTSDEPASTLFHNLNAFTAEPRLAGLAVSADGRRLVTTLSSPNDKGTTYRSALWEIDPDARRPARRLTRSSEGEKGPVFTGSGDLLFVSKRATGSDDGQGDSESSASLWCLSAHGGEAHLVLERPGGVDAAVCATDADIVLLTAPVYPGVNDEQQQKDVHARREDAGVDAILHRSYPVRFWDHDLGPAEPQLLTLTPREDVQLLSGGLEASLREHHCVISPDGTFALTTATIAEAGAEQRSVLVRIEVGSGSHERLIDDAETDVASVLISPDGRSAVVSMSPKSSPQRAPEPTLWLLDLATGGRTQLAADWDRWGTPAAWTGDGSEVLVLADDNGRGPVFAVRVTENDGDPSRGSVRQVTGDDATYSTVVVPPHGPVDVAFGLRSSPAYPAEVVRIDLASGTVTALRGPTERPELPGTLTEVTTSAEDGTDLRGWLALPEEGSGSAPLLVFIHGGPLASSNAWTWRWNPWVLVAHGYAVLMPDPALSTGYGQAFIQRGWGAWGAAPYTDILALTDAVCQREDIDSTRTAALGGSFGGYMANWIAGHTDRFDAIVTHASLWALEGFGPTTDAAFYWSREMTSEMAHENSPHRFVEDIATPMLVIHGDKDYRVPVGEGLRLWYELLAKSALPAADDGSTVHRFLYYPHENHWIMAPQHAKIWYAVVTSFLNQHVLGEPENTPPAELGYAVG